MIERNITDKILTIGPEYRPVEGGISQVIDTYDKEVYASIRFVGETAKGNKLVKGLKCLKACFDEWRQLRSHPNLEIVHIHTCSNISFERSSLFVRIARMMRRKVVLHMHGGGFRDYFERRPEFVKKISSMADAVIALTPGWKQFFTEEVGLDNVVIVNNIINKPSKINRPADGITRMVFLGVITKNKGIFDLLQAIGEIKDRLQGRFKLIIGGLGETDTLNAMIADLGIADLVDYRGWIGGEQKREVMASASAYILCSYFEGLPISILEAMSYGLPIITTNVGGIPEIVDENNGIMVEPGDTEAIKSAILRICDDSDLAARLGRNSLQQIGDYYPDAVSRQLEDLYTRLLNSK